MKSLDHSILSFRAVCQDLLPLQTQLRTCGICRHYFLQRLLSHQRRADSGHRLTRLNDEIVPKAPKTFDLINDSLLVFGNSISEDIAVVAVKVELVNLVQQDTNRPHILALVAATQILCNLVERGLGRYGA